MSSSGNVTDEMWLDDITNQQPPEPDDNFGVTLVRRRADRSGFEPKPEATGFHPVVVHIGLKTIPQVENSEQE